MERIIAKYGTLFKGGIGEAKIDPIKIQVKPGVKPVAQRQRPVPIHYMKPLKEHVQMLLKEGVIEGPLGTEEATEGNNDQRLGQFENKNEFGHKTYGGGGEKCSFPDPNI